MKITIEIYDVNIGIYIYHSTILFSISSRPTLFDSQYSRDENIPEYISASFPFNVLIFFRRKDNNVHFFVFTNRTKILKKNNKKEN